MYIAEAAAVCIFENLFHSLTVLQLLVIKQKPGKKSHDLFDDALCVVNLYYALCEEHT